LKDQIQSIQVSREIVELVWEDW